jgi:hypothetical protein
VSTPALPKPQRFESPEYRSFIRRHHCCVWNCWKRTEAHHVVFDGQGKTGSKVDDTQTVPLCRPHHDAYHELGRADFERAYGLNLAQIIIDLLTEYIREGENLRARG